MIENGPPSASSDSRMRRAKNHADCQAIFGPRCSVMPDMPSMLVAHEWIENARLRGGGFDPAMTIPAGRRNARGDPGGATAWACRR